MVGAAKVVARYDQHRTTSCPCSKPHDSTTGLSSATNFQSHLQIFMALQRKLQFFYYF